MPNSIDNRTEWLEADGLGGYASGTTCGERTRRYHALLLTATRPPIGRMVLVNGLEAWVETPAGRFAISSQRYSPDVVYPDGATRISRFEFEPWPKWTFRFPNGGEITQELFVPHEVSGCVVRWKYSGAAPATLIVRPLLSGRDYHGTHHENSAFRFDAEKRNNWLVWHPYHDVPSVNVLLNGEYSHEPEWFRNFLYLEEQERGLDFNEDLASAGLLRWDLTRDAVLILAAEGYTQVFDNAGTSAEEIVASVSQSELVRRQKFPTPVHRAADAYLVRRGTGQTIIAGYPWFTDWGRDTFISLRGLCLATGRLDEARNILLAWAGTVSEGMLPNRFPDAGDVPEFNSVDASLWFIVAVHDLLEAFAHAGRTLNGNERQILDQAVLAIVAGYSSGTRFGIRLDSDGLLAAGQPGVQLTWMDAKVGDWVVTPRVGKPVEIQALWLNALWIAGRIDRRWNETFERGRAEFEKRFWNGALDCLVDVVDADHRPGVIDAALRPNQIFAVGGLPLALLHGERAKSVVDAVESRLLTPLGLRTLAPGSPGYATQCVGPPRERDGAYHQGTVWPWLLGPFVEAWIRVRGGGAAVKADAKARFLPAIEAHLNSAGLGHISEVTDAELPFTPRGCPFQAWSLGEYLRLKYDVLKE
jgi:predicted glycogen debranching enzyme